MTALQACLNYLNINGIRYTHTNHPVAYSAKDVAAAEFMSAHRVAKSVVFRTEPGYVMVIVPGDKYVDMQQLRAAIGSRELRLAVESEILSVFPSAEVGAMPPLPAIARVPVYLDQALADQEFIAFSAGTHKDVVHMKTSDFRQLAEPVIGNFSRPDFWEDSLVIGL